MKATNETKRVVVTAEELRTVLMNIEGTPFCYLVSKTIESNMNKGSGENVNPYYQAISKVSKSTILLGTEYASRVENNAKKEGNDIEFVPKKASYERVGGVVGYNDNTKNYLLIYEYFKNNSVDVSYFYQGQPIAYDVFSHYLKEKVFAPMTQDCIEKKVNWRTLKLDNIVEITIDHTKYVVEN
jgi:hypothetical protein